VTRAAPLTAFRDASVPVTPGHAAFPRRAELRHDTAPGLNFSIHTNFAAVETDWRRFEQAAEGTPFQTFEWLSAWHRHIGARNGIVPAIVIARFGDGRVAFILPLAVEPGRWVRRLCWLGQELCDYNAPLLARDFSQRVAPTVFVALWRELRIRMQSDPQLRHDWIEFEKMPQTVGVQINPFTHLRVRENANSAHITQLGSDWEAFYRAKRSSATRRRDRTKRKHIENFGEIRFLTAAEPDDVRDTLRTLWEQKKRIFARKGIADIFARPGYHEFFLDFATNPQSRHLAHVSRVDVGATSAAVNFAIVFGDCYYHVLSSYCDGQLIHYGPGTLHLRELLGYAIAKGLQRFDFTIGDEPYKSEWCDLRVELFDYSAAASWRGWPMSAASMTRRRLKRFIKQTPLIWRLVTRFRSAFGALARSRPA
jgi:CelD/BcsL family acetyltransferase involved in cellulose biosynthesis